MTLPTFPTLPTIGFPKRSPLWSTIKQPSVGGQESRFAQWSYPRYKYEYPFEVLRQINGYTEFAALAGFYNQMNGSAGFFGYTDPDDNTIINQPLATGDGATTSFQLVRSLGGFAEPVFLPTAVSLTRSDFVGSTLMYPIARTNYVRNPRSEGAATGTPGTAPTYWQSNYAPGLSRQVVGYGATSGVPWVDIRVFGTATATGLAINLYLDTNNAAATLGSAWTLSAWVMLVAGTLPGGLYLEFGEYGSSSAHYPGTAVATPALWQRTVGTTTITDPTINQIDAMVWVYQTATGAVDFTLRIGGPQLETGSVATSLILPPIGSPAVTTVTDYGLYPNGVVVLASPPASGAAISYTGTYNWLCRFDDDQVDFQKIFDGMWALGSLKFTTEKL